MNIALGSLNAFLGVAYILIGLMTLSDLKKGWKTMGFSHFGAAWVVIAFTCGPHHFVHAIHLLAEGRHGGPLELVAVVAGLPAGLVFLGLRIEAQLRGRGDRFISGTPWWMHLLVPVSAAYLTVLVASTRHLAVAGLPDKVLPNVILVAMYLWVAYYLLRTQIRNRAASNGWSLSGIALTVVFPTCAMMHVMYAVYAATGLYNDVDLHGIAIDWLSVPAIVYFLWVVRGLYKRTLTDWNRSMYDAAPSRSSVVVVSTSSS